MHHTILYFFRQLSIFTSMLALAVVFSAGCSSSGDGEVAEVPGTVPNLLNYTISQETGTSMTVTQNPSATVTSASLTGTFNRTTQEFTLNALRSAVMDVSAADFLAVWDSALGVTFSDYQLFVIVPAAWADDNDPTSGEFAIVSADGMNTIIVNVNNTLPGVDITYLPNGGPTDSTSLTWQEFEAAFDTPPTDKEYAAIASFANILLRFVYEQGRLVILTLEFIGDNSDVMELSGTIVESCDTFTFPPDDTTLSNPGTRMVGWTDEDNDQSIGNGDTVRVDFLDCWDDDPADDFDTLFNGGIVLSNYVEDQTGTTITRVGFESAGGTDGIDFTGLRINDTEDDGVNILISNETLSLTGGFSMVFTAP